MRPAVRLGSVLAALLLPAIAGATFRPASSGKPNYAESFTFLADLDDGTYVHLTLSLTNLGPGSLKGICRAVVVPPAGATWDVSDRVGKDVLAWTAGPPERLRIGACAALADATSTRVEVQLEGGTVRLTYAAPPLPRPPREATALVDGERYRGDVLLDQVAVTASLALPGRPRVDAAGGGYADHSWSTVQPKDLAHSWVRFRALRPPHRLLVLGREAQEGTFGPLWRCTGSDCADGDSFSIERSQKDGAPAFAVEVKGAGAPLALRSKRLLLRDAPVEALGLLGKLVAPFVGSPITYISRATASQPGRPDVEGILEVELDGE